MTVIEEYIEHQNKYQKEYGERTIFLMEVGSFYEYYGVINVPEGKAEKDMTEEDKIRCRWGKLWDVASDDVLKAHISRRGNWKYKPFMAGFPNHAIDKHLDTLLKASYTVVVMKQRTHDTKDPDRYIEGIYSPGINTANLTYESNYLACIYIDPFVFYNTGKTGLSIGISFLDVSTGENKLYETTSKQTDILHSIDEVYRLIQSHCPHEILLYVPQNIIDDDNLSNCITLNAENKLCKKFLISVFELYKTTYHFRAQEKKHSNKRYQEEVLKKIFENSTKMSMFVYLDLTFYEVSLKAYVGMLEFAYSHSEEVTKKIHKPAIISDNKKLILNYNSIQQLEIVANANMTSQSNSHRYDSLLSILNKCRTSMGKRMFKDRLCHPITDPTELKKRYRQVAFFRESVRISNPDADMGGESVDESADKYKYKYKIFEPYLMNINDLEGAHRNMTMGRFLPNVFVGIHRSYMNVASIIDKMGQDKVLFFSDNTTVGFVKFMNEYQNMYDFNVLSRIYRGKIVTNIFKKGVYEELDKLQSKINDYHRAFKLVATEFSKYINDSRRSKNDDMLVKIERNDTDGKFISCTKRRGNLLKQGLKRAGDPTFSIKVSDKLTVTFNSLNIEYKHMRSVTRLKIHELENLAYGLVSLEERMHRKCTDLFKESMRAFLSEEKYKS